MIEEVPDKSGMVSEDDTDLALTLQMQSTCLSPLIIDTCVLAERHEQATPVLGPQDGTGSDGSGLSPEYSASLVVQVSTKGYHRQAPTMTAAEAALANLKVKLRGPPGSNKSAGYKQ